MPYKNREDQLKDFSLGEALSRTDWNWERVLGEIAKCDVLCSNCHRKEHFGKKYPAHSTTVSAVG